jgi:peptidyl-prolyl cis-trans isomerase D
VALTDAEVRAHFDKEKDRYRYPERRVLSYVLVDPASLASRITITEADKEAYYKGNSDQFASEEEACAAHVLVKVKSDDQPEAREEAAARAAAEKALAEVKGGADFAAVARRVSEDQGSAAQGGDLGCFGRGRMVPEFEQAAFALSPGAVSDLVRTPYGFHVIKLVSRKEAATQPYAEVKPRIEQTLHAQRAREVLREAAAAVGDALRRGRGLEAAAREQGLAVQKSAPMARGEMKPPLASSALATRAFELARGQVEPQEFPVMGGFAFIRVDEVQEPRAPGFDEVKDAVKADLARDKAFERARGLAADVRARAQADGLEKAAAGYGLARKQTDALVSHGQSIGDLGAGGAPEAAAFGLAPQQLSEPVRTARGWAVLRVLEKKEADLTAFAAQKASIAQGLEQQRKEQLFRAYVQQARKRFTIETRPEAMRRVTG